MAPKPDPTAQTPPTQTQQQTQQPKPQTPTAVAPLDARHARFAQGASRFITIETPLYKASFNTRGALLARLELNHYKSWYGAPTQLICDSAGFPGVFALSYSGADGHLVSTETMAYTVTGPDKITLGANDSAVIVATLAMPASDSAAAGQPAPTIEKRFVFHGSSYAVGLDIGMKDMAPELARTNPTYELSWRNGVKYQEHNSVEESGKAKAIVRFTEDHHDFDAKEVGATVEERYSGTLEWAGMHTKYFGAAIIPAKPLAGASTVLHGTAVGADSSGVVELYNIAVSAPIANNTVSQHFTLFAGPLEYDAVHSLGISGIVDLGASLIRPISEYVLLPLFRFLHGFIGSYGLVIIVFSLIIRLALWPLSIPQIRSSRKMQLLQPKIAEMRERFKDDQQRQQMESMKLYREYGINPMGGCLPMVLQLPILYALWSTLSSAIELRQASFILWIHDLSVPDYIVQLPMHIPVLGDKLSGLALIMGTTLFIQQKMMITDPKQKMLVYLMPVMLTLAFTNLPSGLNLYYLTFNILSIGQQLYLTKFSKNPLTLEIMREEAKNRKKGWLSQKMEQAQKMAEMQAKAGQARGEGKVDGRTAVEPRNKKKG